MGAAILMFTNSGFGANTLEKLLKFIRPILCQYTQNWQASVSSSSRLQILSEFKTEDFNISKYLLDIRDPLIRKTFTRLRIDLSILQECKSWQNTTDSNNTTCPLCNSSNETVLHFLNECNDNKLTNQRIQFMNLMLPLMPEGE